jgi:hypothetical protein
MKKKQRDIATIALDIEELTAEFREAYHRNDKPKESLTFEQQVVKASQELQSGTPLKDVLNAEDVERAVNMLADVFVVTGVRLPSDY